MAVDQPAAEEAHKRILRSDYQPPPYATHKVHLTFVLNEDVSRVTSTLGIKPNKATGGGAPPAPLVLNGCPKIKLLGVKLAGRSLTQGEDFTVTDKLLTLSSPPAGEFELEVQTEIKPQDNRELQGLYKSGGNFCTQCEAEGFRSITYFQDRPDVMARYTVRIEAERESYPVLLSNGNLIESGELPGDSSRHFTVWEDPFPKPSYLFALVAGKLVSLESKFTTASGRDVLLRIFVQEGNLDRVEHAMDSLKKAMRWDETAFGLEYDLDLFNIVAVDDFNMGAMENKSLNIFNSKLVLASPATATDTDYKLVQGVVAHEYFHNWTGNRVTCSDWFQLTLKEGLTVYRDQEFTKDHNSRAVKRIEDVTRLRTSQYSEDAGPMAHPIRPEAYIKMDNFYTATVYRKGAEVVRLYSTVLGKDGFRKGMDLYFKRHDGQAVTCDDFLAAMADANGADLSSLARWYSTAGTPNLHVSTSYDAAAHTFTITARQSNPKEPSKPPVLIPIRIGLLGPDGKDLPLELQGSCTALGTTTVLRLEKAEESFTFMGVEALPVPSLMRDFSAPVKLTVEGETDEQLAFLLAHDSDPFNRYEAGQRLGKKLLLALYAAAAAGDGDVDAAERCKAAGGVPAVVVSAFRSLLLEKGLDGAFVAHALSLPGVTELVDDTPEADPVLLHNVRTYVVKELAGQLRPELEALLHANDSAPGEPYVFDATSSARRAAKNKALALLTGLEAPELIADTLRRFRSADCMTDQISALSALVRAASAGPEKAAALEEFYAKWKSEPLILLKWIIVQAGSDAPGNLGLVRKLLEHPAFIITNPNSCYHMFMGFSGSAVNFHAADGSGYEFLAEAVLKLDGINGTVAARIASPFTGWRQYDAPRQALMKASLQRILAKPGLSENVFEIVSKALE